MTSVGPPSILPGQAGIPKASVSVVLSFQESLDVRSELVENGGVGCHSSRRPDALVEHCEAGARASVSPPGCLCEHFVNMRTLVSITRDKQLQDLHQPNLQPGGWNPVVVVALWQPVLNHLLENGDERGYQVFVGTSSVHLDHVVEHHHGRRHDARVPVAQSLPHFAHHAVQALLVLLPTCMQD